jgi:putative ABC transport system substrate-binding protein
LVTTFRYAASLPNGSDLTELDQLKRRSFITLLGSAGAWPLAARAQQSSMPVIGFLHTRSQEGFMPVVAALSKALNTAGYVEGKNIAIEYRYANGQYDRLPALAAELVRRQVAVLMAGGGEPSAQAAKGATSTIPIVFVIGSDPVRAGLVESYNRPGRNITGMNILTDTLEPKRLGLLHTLLPQATTLGFLTNPRFASAASQLRDVQEAARALSLQIRVLQASTDAEIDMVFEIVARERIPALEVGADPFLDIHRDKIIALSAHHATPTVYQFREYAVHGGLMSYGIDLPDAYRQAGVYAARILKGAKPADLPVLQPTKFEFVINLKTAKALGVKISDNLLSLADEVIE